MNIVTDMLDGPPKYRHHILTVRLPTIVINLLSRNSKKNKIKGTFYNNTFALVLEQCGGDNAVILDVQVCHWRTLRALYGDV